jgi:Xaa-Pro aminopeptidase
LIGRGIEAFLISRPENRYYLSGFDGSAGFLLVTTARQILATDFRYLEQAGKQAPDYEIFRTTGDVADWLPGLASDMGLSKLALEADEISFAAYQRLAGVLAQNRLELVPQEGLVEAQRAMKDSVEIGLISQAVAISDAGMEHIISTVEPGMTENEAAWELEKLIRNQGSQLLPFPIIVASGENAAMPHATPSNRTIRRGEPVVIDIGARVAGYSSDLSRTVCLGNPDDVFKKAYGIVFEAQVAAIDGICSGMTGKQADALSRDVIEQAGYGTAFGHSLGHGLGLATHEKPHLGPNSSDTLADGMVFTIEPGVYLAGWGGVRIEDTVVLENGRIRVLSRAPKRAI